MNLGDLRTRAASRFRDTQGRFITDDEWDGYINDAYQDIVAVSPHWPFLSDIPGDAPFTHAETLLPGAESFTIPSTLYQRISSLHNATDHIHMLPLFGTQHLDLYPDDTAGRGSPMHYRVHGSTVYVYPVPERTTVIRVEQEGMRPEELSADSDEPVFPEQYHRAIVELALAKAYLDEGDVDRSMVYQQHGDALVRQMVYDLLGPRQEGYPQVPDTFF